MSDQFVVGDVICLKSGGPSMTITTVGDNYGVPTVWCAWFDKKSEHQTGYFPVGAVRKDD